MQYNDPNMDASSEYNRQIAELSADEILHQINMMDAQLRIFHSRFIENPVSTRMSETNGPREKLFTLFGDLLGKYHHDDTMPDEATVNIVTTLIHNIATDHARLFADYSDLIILPNEERAEHAKDHLRETLLIQYSEGYEELVDAVLAELSEAVELEWNIVADYQSKSLKAKTEGVRRKALEAGGDILKISAGTALGVFVANRILGKK